MNLLSFVPQHNFNSSHRRENQGLGYGYTLVYICLETGIIKTAMDIRYYDKGIREYCCVWLNYSPVNAPSISASGSSYVSGSGYHLKTVAVQTALAAAGIMIQFGVHGDTKIQEAILLIAEHIGLNKPSIITQYP